MSEQEKLKEVVGRASAELVQSGMVVGLGSGSTTKYLVQAVGEKVQSGELTDIIGISTSFQSSTIADKYGVRLGSPNDVDHIDLAIDGADEVDPNLNLTKGGGACQTREKLVDSRADKLVIVVDQSKLVDHLGQHMPLPVEVVPDAYRQVTKKLADLGGEATLRMAVNKAGPVVTDQGFLVLDTKFTDMGDLATLEATINNIPGVLENGLFVGLTDSVLVGEMTPAGPKVRTITG